LTSEQEKSFNLVQMLAPGDKNLLIKALGETIQARPCSLCRAREVANTSPSRCPRRNPQKKKDSEVLRRIPSEKVKKESPANEEMPRAVPTRPQRGPGGDQGTA
jgi:hypothetical protein